MKISNYNFTFDLEESESKLMYNSKNNSLAVVERDKYDIFKKFSNDGIMIEEDEFINDLKKGGFILEKDFNEINEIKDRLWRGRYGSNSLSLTIAPTADCNFRCTYCYEKEVLKDHYMTTEIENSIIELVKASSKSIKSLSINWYGGEPLLGLGTIERLSRKFIEICEKESINYGAGMITNGYLLTKENIELLNELKVSFYQVTIDGIQEIHDTRRPLENGEGTFDVIFNNLKENIDIIPKVSLRVNVDKTNSKGADKIIELLEAKGLRPKVNAYLGRVTNDNEDEDLNVQCFSTKEFAKIDLEYTMNNSNEVDWFSKYPRTVNNFCGADSINSYVIGADGELYKCWNDIGIKERAVGNIVNHGTGNAELYFNYMLFDPTEDETCSGCKLLPICMGGCPSYRIQGNLDVCSIYKSSLKDYIKYISQKIISEREKEDAGGKRCSECV